MKRGADADSIADDVTVYGSGRRTGICEGVAICVDHLGAGRGIQAALADVRRMGLATDLERALRGLSRIPEILRDDESSLRCRDAPAPGGMAGVDLGGSTADEEPV